MTWALVPDTPNEDTPARRSGPWSGQAVSSVSSRTAPAVQSTFDDGASTCKVFGSIPWRIASTILITPAAPGRTLLDPPPPPGGARRGPDVRLHRPQPQRTIRIPVLAVGRQQRLRL